jgi:DNA-binding beta-propeller fold protein YncE
MIRFFGRRWPLLAASLVALVVLLLGQSEAGDNKGKGKPKHLLYVVAPGVRDYLQFGGAGILVFDMDNGYKFVKRLPTTASKAAKPENIKGVCANALTRKLYFTTPTKIYCFDLVTEKTLWEKKPEGGCDRLAMTPNGKWLYVPSYEKDHWHVMDAANGEIVKKFIPKSGSHNTVCSLDGKRAYLAGLKSPYLVVIDAEKHEEVGKVGPFSAAIRPFTVDSTNSKCYCCINDLLGFEIGDIKTGKVLHRVEVQGHKKGTPKRHGCPSHGVGLTPDETEVWVCDAANQRLHVFDNTKSPPQQIASIKLREEPGWVTFSIDGKVAISSTGEIIDTLTKKILTALFDEEGREVLSEKIVEIVTLDGVIIQVGDQFGLGRKGLPAMN